MGRQKVLRRPESQEACPGTESQTDSSTERGLRESCRSLPVPYEELEGFLFFRLFLRVSFRPGSPLFKRAERMEL